MHKNWVIKGYDQSVTCLADDPRNLGTPNNILRTPRILSQTRNSIHKKSSKENTGKSQIRRSNQKVQLKNSGLQKESNRTEQRNSNGERNKIRLLIWTQVKFTVAKTCASWLNEKRVSRQRSRHLNRVIPTNERKDKLERKSDQKSRSEINAD